MATHDVPPARLVGIVGWPVQHSLSPAMHNAAFRALGMDWRYDLLPTPAEELAARLAEARDPRFAGVTVTIPHKERVIPFLDEVRDAAAAVGAVNTVVNVDGSLVGHNTDVDGFRWALSRAGVAPAGWDVAMLGAGGGARAAVYALATLGAASVTIFNRTPDRAESLAGQLRPHVGSMTLRVAPFEVEALRATLAQAKLLVNCTSIGMRPNVDACPLPEGLTPESHQVVFDLIYTPRQTRLLQTAAGCGATTVSGLDMLVGQGVEAFKLWTGRVPPADLMRETVVAKLEGA